MTLKYSLSKLKIFGEGYDRQELPYHTYVFEMGIGVGSGGVGWGVGGCLVSGLVLSRSGHLIGSSGRP